MSVSRPASALTSVTTTDGRELALVRRTEPAGDVALLLARLKLELPPQSPPRISADKWH